jgi:hypothetical protein
MRSPEAGAILPVMPYALSFAPDFFRGDNSPSALQPSSRPTNVCQAVLSLRQETWDTTAEHVFGVDSAVLELSTVMARITETNTCCNLDSPVEVFIDAEGDYSVLVYDPADRD